MDDDLEKGYKVMIVVFFGIILCIDVFVICIKLKFRLDIAAYMILLIHLFATGLRIFFNS